MLVQRRRLRIAFRHAFVRGLLSTSFFFAHFSFLNVRVNGFLVLRFDGHFVRGLLVDFVSRIHGGAALFYARRVSDSASIRVLRNGIGTATRVTRVLGNLRATSNFQYGQQREEYRRVTRYFLVTSSRSSTRLIRITRSGVLYLVSGSNVNVESIGSALGGHHNRRCVVVVVSGIRSGLFRLFQLRLSIPSACPTVECVPRGRHLRFRRVLGAIIRGRGLPITTRFGVSNFKCGFFVRYVCFHLGEMAIKEEYLSSQRISNPRRERLGNAQGEDDHRYRHVCVGLRLAGLFFRTCARLLLLIGSGRARVLRFSAFTGGLVHASGSVSFSINRLFRGATYVLYHAYPT